MSKNKSPDFIGVWKINSSLCEDIINFYNEHKDSHHQGISGDKIDLNKKKSIKSITCRNCFEPLLALTADLGDPTEDAPISSPPGALRTVLGW